MRPEVISGGNAAKSIAVAKDMFPYLSYGVFVDHPNAAESAPKLFNGMHIGYASMSPNW
jgi:hypothetical protein